MDLGIYELNTVTNFYVSVEAFTLHKKVNK